MSERTGPSDAVRIIGRTAARAALSRLLSWDPRAEAAAEGFSIVLGVPWDLRHLLGVNLEFVARTDTRLLRDLFVVFDRRHRPEMDGIIERAKARFPSLPLRPVWYPPAAGAIVERLNISTFYNSLNTVLALRACRTRYAVLHDFDLYPLEADHFTSIVDTMRSQSLHFCGHELTHFQGLTDEDRQIGTWTLGIDVAEVRRKYRPIRCFHTFYKLRGRRISLDPYAWLQFQTEQRGLSSRAKAIRFCHVQNLCSTYLRFLGGKWLKIAWRLHYLWYLESVPDNPARLLEVAEAMDQNRDGVLKVDRLPADFSKTHASCVSILAREVQAMEGFLFGGLRPEARRYLDSAERFLCRIGDTTDVLDSAGQIQWTMHKSKPADEAVQASL